MNIALFLCLNSLTVTKNSFKTSYTCSHMYARMLSCFSSVRLFVILWTPQAPLFMGFSRQEYSSGLPCPLPGDLPDPGINLCLLNLSPALAGGFFTTSATWEAQPYLYIVQTGKVLVIFLLFPTVSWSFTHLG